MEIAEKIASGDLSGVTVSDMEKAGIMPGEQPSTGTGTISESIISGLRTP